MALKKVFSLPAKISTTGEFWNGPAKDTVTIADCYIKVESVIGGKSNVTAQVSFTAPNLSGAKSYSFAPDMSGPNFIAQSYNHLKTLPEFENAEDC